MSEIHPTAILDCRCDLAADVTIGPHCVLSGAIIVGSGTRLVGNVYLQGPLTMGKANTIYPFACLGFAPQHAKFDPQEPGHGLVIGDRNTFREHVTIHRAFTDDGPTRIGDDNCFMVNSHVGHDCLVGDHCTFVNNSALGGHCVIDDHVIIGGGSVVHQFCRIGHGVMMAGAAGTTMDVPPWFMITGINVCGGVNLVGLRRSGMSREQIEEVRWVYRTLFREGHTVKHALELLKERSDSDLIQQYIQFIESSERGICRGQGQGARGMN
ncbi:MAG: acyl-ACP--UDP-N-acetylglucosamine O-acyltransferase [Phycisphaerales bacterium]|nr:MAG: acyl-ACP--UDP-N-acetylglucosamine O-acyltransferase [Phycisphaerales bacterium]